MVRGDYDAVMRPLEQLFRRRKRVPELLLSARNCNRRPFPYWVGDAGRNGVIRVL
jgi:hypothetical protein